jgi:hypothetical protein
MGCGIHIPCINRNFLVSKFELSTIAAPIPKRLKGLNECLNLAVCRNTWGPVQTQRRRVILVWPPNVISSTSSPCNTLITAIFGTLEPPDLALKPREGFFDFVAQNLNWMVFGVHA